MYVRVCGVCIYLYMKIYIAYDDDVLGSHVTFPDASCHVCACV